MKVQEVIELLQSLLAEGKLKPDDPIVIHNDSDGINYEVDLSLDESEVVVWPLEWGRVRLRS